MFCSKDLGFEHSELERMEEFFRYKGKKAFNFQAGVIYSEFSYFSFV